MDPYKLDTRRYKRDVCFLQAPVTPIFRVHLYDSNGTLVRSYSDSECSLEKVESRARTRYPDMTVEVSEIL
jgi:hypothetical protein